VRRKKKRGGEKQKKVKKGKRPENGSSVGLRTSRKEKLVTKNIENGCCKKQQGHARSSLMGRNCGWGPGVAWAESTCGSFSDGTGKRGSFGASHSQRVGRERKPRRRKKSWTVGRKKAVSEVTTAQGKNEAARQQPDNVEDQKTLPTGEKQPTN